MEILNTQQNTDKWLEERKKVIGGSDVPIILGISPYKTRYRLWQEKLDLVEPEEKSFIHAKGHLLEDKARTIYELLNDIDIPPKVVRKDDPKFPWAQVSLDGLSLETRNAVEIKYVGESAFDEVLLRGVIPDHHHAQLQYQMFVTGFNSIDYVAYSEKRNNIAVKKVEADKEFIAKMVASCEEFWWELKNEIPPRLVEKDFRKVIPAPIRRTVEALKEMLKSKYPGVTRLHWDGLYMELKDGKEK